MFQSENWKNWLRSNKKLFIGHIIVWVVLGVLFNLVLLDVYSFEWHFFVKAILNLALNAFVFYVSALIITPSYLQKPRPYFHLSMALILIYGVTTLTFLTNNSRIDFIKEKLEVVDFTFYVFESIGPVCFFVFGITYALAFDWISNLKQNSQLKNKQLETELKLLKSQIQPHFLFNTLNNIYTLCYIKDDRAAPMVMNLSRLLRYILYDCQADKVALQKDLEFLNCFIELQELKKSDSQNVSLQSFNVKAHHQIAPLLLMNFLENAFKHGDWDSNPEAFMEVNINIEEEILFFDISNSVNPKRHIVSSDTSGIGLENVKRRLELLYPGQYELKFDQNKDFDLFMVSLILRLS